MGHHDAVVDFGGGLARGFGDDGLVALAVDHDLPLAFALIAAGLGVLHDRKTPLLEFVHGGVDVARDVVAQVFAHQPHQVVARVAHMIFGLVLAPLHAHVAVDRVEALGHRAAALDVRLLDADDLEVAAPIAGFVGGAATGHAAADDENVRIHEDGFSARRTNPLANAPFQLVGASAGSLSM